MKAYLLYEPAGIDALSLEQIAEPRPTSTQVIVAMKAWSLNYRDLAMPAGGYLRNDKIKIAPPLIPLSDGAGEVVAVGDSVTRFRVGDRVAGCFFQDWVDGDINETQMGSALGGAINGVLAEYVAFSEHGTVHVPDHLSYEEAATLPCAALTAWQALTMANMKAGDTVLMLGTGGVSIFALQLAKAFGGRAIITSSDDQKLERARELGADETINYRTTESWDEHVRQLTDGVGVDNVIEVGGSGTLERSLRAARVSGTVSLIGVLTGQPEQNPSPMLALFNRTTIRGIYVGSQRMFQQMNQAISINNIRPVIDRIFSFEQTKEAYRYLVSGKHLGKVVISAA